MTYEPYKKVKFFDYVTTGVRELRSTDFTIGINGEIRCVHPDIRKKNGMIMFYANWCNQSRALKQTWSDMAQAGGLRFPFMAVNCEIERGIANSLKITGYPTFKFVNVDGTLGHYNGSRTLGGFNAFMCQSIGIETGQNNNIRASNFHYNTGIFDGHKENFQSRLQQTNMAHDPRKDKYAPSSYSLKPNAPEEKYKTDNPMKKIRIPRPQFW